MSRRATTTHPVRFWGVLGLMLAASGLLAVRAAYLQVWSSDYLQEQGRERHLRVMEDAQPRAMILDRNGEPLAISTPVDSVWANPSELAQARAQWSELARLLGMSQQELARNIARHREREFMYLKRHVPPHLAARVMALKTPGVALQREYRRYYPAGAITAHVVGFTNVDDRGQEGLELAYDEWLQTVPGRKRVLKDRFGNTLETVESVSLPMPGEDLRISIDRRIQYLAYRELKAAIETHGAKSGSIVVLDAQSGEVLALVNEPGFNPNNRAGLRHEVFRNRAVTDVYEPGSTVKAFTVAAGLMSGRYRATTPIDTAPGILKVGHNFIRDTHNYGRLTVAEVIQKSSNIGATKIALSLPKESLWGVFRAVGFGDYTGSGLPGESTGLLNTPKRWGQIEQATLSYGYGLSVTPLQLARAYASLANGGRLVPVTMLYQKDPQPENVQALPEHIVRDVRSMLEQAVTPEGTGVRARVAHYRVAGKTGTAHKLGSGGYADDEYIASFAGFAPASDPRLVMVVMIDNPSRGGHFGGDVAAPVFSRVMDGALRLLNIAPDAPFAPSPTPGRMAEISPREDRV